MPAMLAALHRMHHATCQMEQKAAPGRPKVNLPVKDAPARRRSISSTKDKAEMRTLNERKKILESC